MFSPKKQLLHKLYFRLPVVPLQDRKEVFHPNLLQDKMSPVLHPDVFGNDAGLH